MHATPIMLAYTRWDIWIGLLQYNPSTGILGFCLHFASPVGPYILSLAYCAFSVTSQDKSKEKHGAQDSMPWLTITSPYVDARVDPNTFIMGNPTPESTRVDFIPQSATLDLASDIIPPLVN